MSKLTWNVFLNELNLTILVQDGELRTNTYYFKTRKTSFSSSVDSDNQEMIKLYGDDTAMLLRTIMDWVIEDMATLFMNPFMDEFDAREYCTYIMPFDYTDFEKYDSSMDGEQSSEVHTTVINEAFDKFHAKSTGQYESRYYSIEIECNGTKLNVPFDNLSSQEQSILRSGEKSTHCLTIEQ